MPLTARDFDECRRIMERKRGTAAPEELARYAIMAGGFIFRAIPEDLAALADSYRRRPGDVL